MAIRARLSTLHRSIRRAVLARRRLLAAGFAAVAVGAGLQAAAAEPPALVPVPVATRDLPAGTVLTGDDVEPVGFAPGTVPAGAESDGSALAGRTLAAPLRAGEPVTDVRLVGPALTEGYPGMSAVPVRLPDPGMAELLRVGDRIDLIAADPQGESAVVAYGVPILALPAASASTTATGLPGSLVVVGARASEVTRIADASARTYLTVAFSD